MLSRPSGAQRHRQRRAGVCSVALKKGWEYAGAGCVTITAAARGQDTVGSCVRLHTN